MEERVRLVKSVEHSWPQRSLVLFKGFISGSGNLPEDRISAVVNFAAKVTSAVPALRCGNDTAFERGKDDTVTLAHAVEHIIASTIEAVGPQIGCEVVCGHTRGVAENLALVRLLVKGSSLMKGDLTRGVRHAVEAINIILSNEPKK